MKPLFQPKVIASGLFVGLLGSLSASPASAGDIFVTNANIGTVGEYTTSGATVNAALISGLSLPEDIAVSGSDLFVVNSGSGTIGEYTTSGATVNAALISGLSEPAGIAVSGSDLFVTNTFGGMIGTGTIGEYTTSGATVNAALISGLSDPAGIAISGPIIPEASTWVMSLTGFAALAFVGFRRARSRAVSA
jgi:hypothetical protein